MKPTILLGCVFLIVAGLRGPAAQAQEALCNPCLDVPADYQALKPLPTDWPPPSSPIYLPSTRFNMGATGPIDMRRTSDSQQLNMQQRIQILRGLEIARRIRPPVAEPAGADEATPPTGPESLANPPPPSDPGRTGENAP